MSKKNGRESFYSALRNRDDKRASVWIVHFFKAGGRFSLERDAVVFGSILLEADVNVVSYIPQPKCPSVPCILANGRKISVSADAISTDVNRKVVWHKYSRGNLHWRVAEVLNQAAEREGATFVNVTVENFKGLDVLVDNWLLLNGSASARKFLLLIPSTPTRDCSRRPCCPSRQRCETA